MPSDCTGTDPRSSTFLASRRCSKTSSASFAPPRINSETPLRFAHWQSAKTQKGAIAMTGSPPGRLKWCHQLHQRSPRRSEKVAGENAVPGAKGVQMLSCSSLRHHGIGCSRQLFRRNPWARSDRRYSLRPDQADQKICSKTPYICLKMILSIAVPRDKRRRRMAHWYHGIQ